MINRIVLTASAFAVVTAAANAQVPFLSFADNGTIAARRVGNTPATTSSTFTATGAGYTNKTSPVAAQLNTLSYTLNGATPLTAFSGSTALQSEAVTSGGSINVTDSVRGLLFTVTFGSGELNANGFSASDAQGDAVVYSNINSILAPYITNTTTGDAFGFSFANTAITGTTVTYTTQGQFSSTPVPEPTTMAALGLGAVAMLRRRRKA